MENEEFKSSLRTIGEGNFFFYLEMRYLNYIWTLLTGLGFNKLWQKLYMKEFSRIFYFFNLNLFILIGG